MRPLPYLPPFIPKTPPKPCSLWTTRRSLQAVGLSS
jgi:hypothetical protein